LTYWLRQVTSRRCIDLARRWWQRVVPIEKVEEPRAAVAWSDPLFDRKLRGLIADLPAQQRVVLTLRYQEDLGPAEIARVVAMPVNTVKSHLHRALEALRKGFGES
jgi:RNA polymerase sigma-70 factor (ECF subfamily)